MSAEIKTPSVPTLQDMNDALNGGDYRSVALVRRLRDLLASGAYVLVSREQVAHHDALVAALKGLQHASPASGWEQHNAHKAAAAVLQSLGHPSEKGTQCLKRMKSINRYRTWQAPSRV